MVHTVGYHGFRHLSEVSAEHASDIMGGVMLLFPVQVLAIL